MDLYTMNEKVVTVYPRRTPCQDGAFPAPNLLFAAVLTTLVSLLVLSRTEVMPPELRPYRILFYSSLILVCGVYIYSQFLRVTISTATGDIHYDYLLFRRRLGRLMDFDEIRILEYEWGGNPYYYFAGVWRKDRLRTPLSFSPRCRTLNQLSHFRRTLIPALQAIYPRLTIPSQPGKPFTGPQPEEPDDQPAEPRYRPIPRWIYTDSFWSHNLCQVILVTLATVGMAVLIRKAELWQDGRLPVKLMAIMLFVPSVLAIALLAWKLLGYYVRAAHRNQTIALNPQERIIEFRTAFGLSRHVFTYESLKDIRLAFYRSHTQICLVLEGCIVNPTAAMCSDAAETRLALKKICASLGIADDEWVEILRRGNDFRYRYHYDPYQGPRKAPVVGARR